MIRIKNFREMLDEAKKSLEKDSNHNMDYIEAMTYVLGNWQHLETYNDIFGDYFPQTVTQKILDDKFAPKECQQHEWKFYEGFSNSFTYCQKCDIKK